MEEIAGWDPPRNHNERSETCEGQNGRIVLIEYIL